MEHKIFQIMGKSSSGKDTIKNLILHDFEKKEWESFSMKEAIMHTTRPIREKEQDGVDYFFTTEEIYQNMLLEKKVLECRSYETMHGLWRYFTSVSAFDLEHYNYLIVNTLEGYQSLVSYFGKDVVYPFYVEVEDGKRLERAINREKSQRNPKYQELCRRFLADNEDFSEEKLLALGIVKRYKNDADIMVCKNQIEEDIKKLLLK